MYNQKPKPHIKTYRKAVRLLMVSILIIVASAVAFGWKDASRSTGDEPQSPATGQQDTTQSFNKKAHSLTDPTSPWVIINKKRALAPITYAPTDLVAPKVPLRLSADNDEMLMRAEVATALETLVTDAKQQNAQFMVASAYRSYAFQKNLYSLYVKQQGQATADTQSARPGHSEHQTGLAVDLEPTNRTCEIQTCFAETTEGKWLAEHAYKYGFVIRYAEGSEATTGYIYEPWHIRYVGKSLATEAHHTGAKTLEDFFGLEKAANY